MTRTQPKPPSNVANLPDHWRVLIVDDHELFRTGLRELLSRDADVEVVGEAANAHDAVERFRELQPNLVITDISLADGDGLQIVERIKAIDPNTFVLVISMFDEEVFADRAIAVGASGYICKQATNAELLEALRTLRRSGLYISPSVTQRMVQRGTPSGTALSEENLLSTRELQIFTMIGQGLTTQQVAQRLHLSTSTIETYRERIKGKLNLASGAELTRRAIVWLMHKS